MNLPTAIRRCSVRRLVCPLLVALLISWMIAPARADSIANYSIFAGHSIVGTGGINAGGAVVGANGDLFLAGITAQAIRNGGSIFDTFGSVNTTGDVTTNGNATMTFFGSVGGDLNVGGNAHLSANVGGDILAGGNVTTSGNTAGDIFAGGSINATGTVGGTLHPFSGVIPPAFTPVTLPGVHAFASGGPNITLNTFGSQTLAPGSYGELLLNGSNTVNLSAGDYFFTDIRMVGSFATFNFSTAGGPINLFVTGDVFLKSASMNLNGVSSDNVTPGDAADVYWETHNNYHTEFSHMLGTVYSPLGDIQLFSLASLNGVIIAGHDIITDGITFKPGAPSPSLIVVPEPAALVLIGAAVPGLALVCARRRRGLAA